MFDNTGEIVTEVIHLICSSKWQAIFNTTSNWRATIKQSRKAAIWRQGWICTTSSTRLSSWWKMLQEYVSGTELAEQFELTLEVTHHGPWLNVPAMFIEIGSTEKTWPNEEAAELLARIIADGMALDGKNNIGLWDEKANSGDLVLVTLGGGHYAPRANKLASMDGVWLGHMLATYALPFEKPEDETELPGGNWKQALESAI